MPEPWYWRLSDYLGIRLPGSQIQDPDNPSLKDRYDQFVQAADEYNPYKKFKELEEGPVVDRTTGPYFTPEKLEPLANPDDYIYHSPKPYSDLEDQVKFEPTGGLVPLRHQLDALTNSTESDIALADLEKQERDARAKEFQSPTDLLVDPYIPQSAIEGAVKGGVAAADEFTEGQFNPVNLGLLAASMGAGALGSSRAASALAGFDEAKALESTGQLKQIPEVLDRARQAAAQADLIKKGEQAFNAAQYGVSVDELAKIAGSDLPIEQKLPRLASGTAFATMGLEPMAQHKAGSELGELPDFTKATERNVPDVPLAPLPDSPAPQPDRIPELVPDDWRPDFQEPELKFSEPPSQVPDTIDKRKFGFADTLEPQAARYSPEEQPLVATHGLTTKNLTEQLKELGGFAAPSIAVADAENSKIFGDAKTVVFFKKSTVDPKVDPKNKLYSGDAWTPTFPGDRIHSKPKYYNISEANADYYGLEPGQLDASRVEEIKQRVYNRGMIRDLGLTSVFDPSFDPSFDLSQPELVKDLQKGLVTYLRNNGPVEGGIPHRYVKLILDYILPGFNLDLYIDDITHEIDPNVRRTRQNRLMDRVADYMGRLDEENKAEAGRFLRSVESTNRTKYIQGTDLDQVNSSKAMDALDKYIDPAMDQVTKDSIRSRTLIDNKTMKEVFELAYDLMAPSHPYKSGIPNSEYPNVFGARSRAEAIEMMALDMGLGEGELSYTADNIARIIESEERDALSAGAHVAELPDLEWSRSAFKEGRAGYVKDFGTPGGRQRAQEANNAAELKVREYISDMPEYTALVTKARENGDNPQFILNYILDDSFANIQLDSMPAGHSMYPEASTLISAIRQFLRKNPDIRKPIEMNRLLKEGRLEAYHEAKPYRAVKPDEIAGVILPEAMARQIAPHLPKPEIVQLLESLGIPYKFSGNKPEQIAAASAEFSGARFAKTGTREPVIPDPKAITDNPAVKKLVSHIDDAARYFKKITEPLIPELANYDIRINVGKPTGNLGVTYQGHDLIEVNLPDIILNLQESLVEQGVRNLIDPKTGKAHGTPIDTDLVAKHMADIYEKNPDQFVEDVWYSTTWTILHELAHAEPGARHSEGGFFPFEPAANFDTPQKKYEAVYNMVIGHINEGQLAQVRSKFDAGTVREAARSIFRASPEIVSDGTGAIQRQPGVVGSDQQGGRNLAETAAKSGYEKTFRETVDKSLPDALKDYETTYRGLPLKFDSPFDKFSWLVAKHPKELLSNYPGLAAKIARDMGIRYDDLVLHGNMIATAINLMDRAGKKSLDVPEAHYYGLVPGSKEVPINYKLIGSRDQALEKENTPKAKAELPEHSDNQHGYVDWVNNHHARQFEELATEQKLPALPAESFLANMYRSKETFDHLQSKLDELKATGVDKWEVMERVAYGMFQETEAPIIQRILKELKEKGDFGERKEGAEHGSTEFTLDNVHKLYERVQKYNDEFADQEPIQLRFDSSNKFAAWLDGMISDAINDRKFANFLFSRGLVKRGSDLTRAELKEISKPDSPYTRLNSDRFPFRKVLPEQWTDKNDTYYTTKGFAAKFDEYLNTDRDRAGDQGFIDFVDKGLNLVKNIQLSSGIPGTIINSHGISLGMRRILSGRTGGIKSRLSEVFSDPTGRKQLEYFSAHVPEAADAIKHGLTLTSEEHRINNPKRTARTLSEAWRAAREEAKDIPGGFFSRTLGKVSAYHTQLFDLPLFERALLGWKLRTYTEAVEMLKAKGLSDRQAKVKAATYTNNAYGGLNYDAVGRTRNFKTMMKFFLLAPDWFESNFGLPRLTGKVGARFGAEDPVFKQSYEHAGWNGAQEFGILKQSLFGKDRSLYAKAAINYGLFFAVTSIINKLMTDQIDPGLKQPSRLGTIELPSWNDKLISGKPSGKTAYLKPQSTSADVYTLPFVIMASMAKEKNPVNAIARPIKYYWYRAGIPLKFFAATLLPSPIDRFGDPIAFKPYGGAVPWEQQAGKRFKEAVSAILPPYIDAPMEYFLGNNGLMESGLQAVEIPTRFSRKKKSKGTSNELGILTDTDLGLPELTEP